MKSCKSIVLLLFAVCFCLGACTSVRYCPDSGTWYCEELQAQIIGDVPENFNPLNNDESGIYVIVDGNKIACTCDMPPNCPYLMIVCQETNNERFSLGEVIYDLTVVSLSDTEYVVKDDAGNQYTFIRVD